MDFSGLHILWCMDMLHQKGNATSRHNHSFYHYIYVREGTGRAVIDGQDVSLTPHNLYAFNPLVFHGFSADEGGLRLYEIKFEVHDADLAAGLSHLTIVTPVSAELCERIFSLLVSENDTEDEWSAAHRRALLFELLVHLLRQNRDGAEKEDSRALAEVARYMRENYGRELRNEVLAAMLHMERGYFIKQFKRRFGIPPMRYLMTLRMERAASLIENSDMNASKVAELVGFKSIHHFSNAFKKHWGLSPVQYREKHTKT